MALPRNGSPLARPCPQIYVIAGPTQDAGALRQVLKASAAFAEVAAVLLRPAADASAAAETVKALAPHVQERGVACLIAGHAELVAATGADGAHLTGAAALGAALPLLRPGRIAGAGGLPTRHEAMLAGEAGADYVMFGEPGADGRRPGFRAILERVAWWSEICEPACVGFAGDLDELAALVEAGADFVALEDVVWNHPQGPAAALTAVADRLRAMEFS